MTKQLVSAQGTLYRLVWQSAVPCYAGMRAVWLQAVIPMEMVLPISGLFL